MTNELFPTAAFARQIGYKPASIRTAVWRNGHFNGIRPVKLPNGRLLWPADSVERLMSTSQQAA